jgi:hypothetical protein
MTAPRAMTAVVIGLPTKESEGGSFLAASASPNAKRKACGRAAAGYYEGLAFRVAKRRKRTR